MLKWSILTMIWFLSLPCLGTDSPKIGPTLNFEIPVKPATPLGKVVTGALTKVMQDLGYNLQIQVYPSKRGLHELKAGRIDGSVGRLGNLASLMSINDLVRIDFPIAVFKISRWCRKDMNKSQPPITVGVGLGHVLMTLLEDHLDANRLQLHNMRDQKTAIQMLNAGRLDCLLTNELVLETEGIPVEDLKAFDRFDHMTIEGFPWILKRHAHLKPGIEAGLKSYPFPEIFRKKFQNKSPACEGNLNVLCPDGLLFLQKIDFR